MISPAGKFQVRFKLTELLLILHPDPLDMAAWKSGSGIFGKGLCSKKLTLRPTNAPSPAGREVLSQ